MTFTKVTVSKTAQVLTSAADTLLVENLRLFHDTLELPASHFEILRLRHLLGAEGYYGVFSKILEEWVNQSGLSASTDMLIRVLKEIEFISVAGLYKYLLIILCKASTSVRNFVKFS